MNRTDRTPDPGLPIRRVPRGVPKNAFSDDQIALVYDRMAALKIGSDGELAALIGTKHQNVSNWLHKKRGTKRQMEAKLADVLGLTWAEWRDAAATLARLREPNRNPDGEGKVTIPGAERGKSLAPEGVYDIETLELVESRRVGEGRYPIYDGTGAGNPVAPDESARPFVVARKDFGGKGKIRLIGKRGFGVRVRGESLSMWEIHTGDVVWINPDMRPKYNHPNLFLFRRDGYEGYCLKVLKHNGTEDYLISDGEDGPGEPIPVQDVMPVGPVVLCDSSRVPQRRNILKDQAHLVDRVNKPIPLPDARLEPDMPSGRTRRAG